MYFKMVYFLVILTILQSFVMISAAANGENEVMNPYMLPIPPNNHGIQPKVLIDEEIKILRNNLLTTIPIWSSEWSVSFKVRILSFTGETWQSLIRFTSDPSIDFGHGTFIPGVFFQSFSKYFRFYSKLNGNDIIAFNSETINSNQTYHLEIHQRYIANGEYRYYIIVDGVEVYSVVNTDARQFYNVHVYASDNFYQQADAYISDFKYVNFL